MDTFFRAFADAFRLLGSLDADLLVILWMTLQVTGGALLLATVLGLPIGVGLGLQEHLPGKGVIMPLIYTGMGLPPVVVGLFVYLLLSNRGPLRGLEWLFTPNGMILAQTVIAWPLLVGLSATAVSAIDPGFRLQIQSLGATRWQLAWTLLGEARTGILAAITAAFGSIISEVGAVMLVGGNIEGQTRVLTTAIVLETRKGNFALALALGIILLGLAFVANVVLYQLNARKSEG